MPEHQEREVREKRRGYLMVASLVVLTTLSGLHMLEAKDGPDFAGFYELREAVEPLRLVVGVTLAEGEARHGGGIVSDDGFGGEVVDQGDQINGRFVAQIFNLLEDSMLPGDPYAEWPSMSLFDRQSVRVEAWVTIPKLEYEQWQQGARPRAGEGPDTPLESVDPGHRRDLPEAVPGAP